MNLTGNLQEDLSLIKKRIKSDDAEFVKLKIGDYDGYLIFINTLVNKDYLGELVLKPSKELKGKPTKDEIFEAFLSPEKIMIESIDETILEIVDGNAVMLCDTISSAFSFEAKYFQTRSISEPPTSTVIKGPREGFVESLPLNINLIRKKLKTPDLRIENLKIGRYSQTAMCICYVDGIVDKNLVKTLREKLQNIDTDAILDSSYVSKFLGNKNTALFKQIGNTEKPDILAGKILEGRVAIIVDGSPIALTCPYLLLEDFQSPSDYYGSSYNATFSRILRLFSVVISVLLPSFFVAAELYHIQLIPLSFLLTITNSLKGIPLSPGYEVFFTLFIFEILNEASVRMPRYVGMVVSIVGGLVLGETAVSAGIISAPTLMIVALSGICLYTVPELSQTFSIVRLLLLIIATSFGIYGILITCGLFLIYMISFESFNTPICAPYSPLVLKDLKDGIYKGFMPEMSSRPLSIKNANHHRNNHHA